MGQPLEQSVDRDLPAAGRRQPGDRADVGLHASSGCWTTVAARRSVDADEIVRLCEAYSIVERVRLVHRAGERRRVPALEDRAPERGARRARRACAEAVRQKLEALRRKAEQQVGPVDPDARPSPAPTPAASQAPAPSRPPEGLRPATASPSRWWVQSTP